jgi:hypothetical protein
MRWADRIVWGRASTKVYVVIETHMIEWTVVKVKLKCNLSGVRMFRFDGITTKKRRFLYATATLRVVFSRYCIAFSRYCSHSPDLEHPAALHTRRGYHLRHHGIAGHIPDSDPLLSQPRTFAKSR